MTVNPYFLKKIHDPSCRSVSATVCQCGFVQWFVQQDHSKNIPTTTDPNVKPYDARDMWDKGPLKLTI
jgi:hypothetical protein